MREIKHGNFTFDAEGVQINEGVRVSWANLAKIMEALPEVAFKQLAWFTLSGPPSACAQASRELQEIAQALFPERKAPPLPPGTYTAKATDIFKKPGRIEMKIQIDAPGSPVVSKAIHKHPSRRRK